MIDLLAFHYNVILLHLSLEDPTERNIATIGANTNCVKHVTLLIIIFL